MLDEFLHHHDSVGTSADIRVHRDHEDTIRHAIIHIIELLAPDLKDLRGSMKPRVNAWLRVELVEWPVVDDPGDRQLEDA